MDNDSNNAFTNHDSECELPPEFSSLTFSGLTDALLTFKFFASKTDKVCETENQNIKEENGQEACIYMFFLNSVKKKYTPSKQNSCLCQKIKSKRRKLFMFLNKIL